MYEKFKELDGTHPWRNVSPDGYVDYRARYRPQGRVLFFNFALAKEMGLVPEEHPASINKELEQVILDTFSLRIINEYDIEHGTKFPPESVRPKPFMATRYLQTQHRNKQGKTSGDGRSIWNGYLKSDKLTFDVSSRGTGATILSPGAQEAEAALPTGDTTRDYSSGMAYLDEMLGSAVMSEIFYRQGIPTERCLTVIGYPDTSAIGVRSAPNLIRPAHIFRYLKQARHAEVKASVDYFIEREIENGTWTMPDDPAQRYATTLDYFARNYAKLAALLEEEYIFNWLSWDGDNMLASGAILDYGSIRQFAAKHDKYRFKDLDRYSASLAEQRGWARTLVQVFAQVMDFIETGEKKNLNNFKNAECLRVFDEAFAVERDQRMLWRIGFTPEQIAYLMDHAGQQVRDFDRSLSYFEDRKVAKGIEKLPDGFTHNPVFLIRNLLRTLPGYYLSHAITRADDESVHMSNEVFLQSDGRLIRRQARSETHRSPRRAHQKLPAVLPAARRSPRWTTGSRPENTSGTFGSHQSSSSHHRRRSNLDHRRDYRDQRQDQDRRFAGSARRVYRLASADPRKVAPGRTRKAQLQHAKVPPAAKDSTEFGDLQGIDLSCAV